MIFSNIFHCRIDAWQQHPPSVFFVAFGDGQIVTYM